MVAPHSHRVCLRNVLPATGFGFYCLGVASEPNLLLDAWIERAGLSHAGLAVRLNAHSSARGSRYDHASVARWVRDSAVPRSPTPEIICQIFGERLGIRLAPADIGMDQRPAANVNVPLQQAVDRAAALWRGDLVRDGQGVAASLLTGPRAVQPV